MSALNVTAREWVTSGGGGGGGAAAGPGSEPLAALVHRYEPKRYRPGILSRLIWPLRLVPGIWTLAPRAGRLFFNAVKSGRRDIARSGKNASSRRALLLHAGGVVSFFSNCGTNALFILIFGRL